ncbi:MAG TPA: L-histidine N(alpha)-methyltransferase [Terriglobales bacterium]
MSIPQTLIDPVLTGFAAEVADGLTQPGQRTLPCKYLYDEVGSRLFEAICALPEYGLTAADIRLLRQHADAIAATMEAPMGAGHGGGAGVLVAELGSGSARKTRPMLEALCRRAPVLYLPIEISPWALARSQRELADVPGLEIAPQPFEYLAGLAAATARRATPRWRQHPMLVLFLGSTLGNFAPAEARTLLRALRRQLRPGDALLLGVDLVKPKAQLLAAYDDPAGVTAAFNLNLLARINRELGADFDLRGWQHRVRFRHHRIEMHLRSRREQIVRLEAATAPLHFRRGETIWTESSHKFRLADLDALAAASGFQPHRQWVDSIWPFAENLWLSA